MKCHVEDDAKEIGAAYEVTQPIFDLSREGHTVFEALVREVPQVAVELDSLMKRIPLPKDAVPKVEGNFYRLPGHNRSYCYALCASQHMSVSPAVVFKGAEPLLSDFPAMLDWLAQAPLRKSARVMADHFPLAEGKIPGVLSKKEALREASIALAVQKAHLERYGALARLPVPLVIHSIGDHKRNACISLLAEKLAGSAFERIEALVQSGIAIYIYYYPSPPIRANYLGEMGAAQFRQFVDKELNTENLVLSWTRLIARLLYLGYLPYNIRNEGLGACMDFGNAALDGGFCDPDSILLTEPNLDDEFFRESAIQTLSILQSTVGRVLGLSSDSALYPNIEEFVLRQYMGHLINSALVSERRPGLEVDPRFLKLLSPRSLADVKSCTSRRNRVHTYALHAKQRHRVHIEEEAGISYP